MHTHTCQVARGASSARAPPWLPLKYRCTGPSHDRTLSAQAPAALGFHFLCHLCQEALPSPGFCVALSARLGPAGVKGGESSECPSAYLLAWQHLCRLGPDPLGGWASGIAGERQLRAAPVGSDASPGQAGAEGGGSSEGLWALLFSLGHSPEACQSTGSESRPGPASCWLCGPGKSFPLPGNRLQLWEAAQPG